MEKKLCVLTEWPLRDGWEKDLLERTLLRAGVSLSSVVWRSVLPDRPPHGLFFKAKDVALLKEVTIRGLLELAPAVILACGEGALQTVCEFEGIDKWQASVLPQAAYVVIPCYSTDRVMKDLSLQLWVSLCARKAQVALTQPPLETKYDFLLNPPLEEALAFLRERVRTAPAVSVDIETGRGQINTIGFAISSSEAIALNVLPDRLGAESFHVLWSELRGILEGDQPKILQNFIYEHAFFSRYGIRLAGVTHDTMIAQKFLWPEFEMGLDAVGRMYSDQPYWKDDNKSWNNIRDWNQHYLYNCKDTVGTYQGYLGQRRDLKERGLLELHDDYLVKLYPAVAEMCARGIPIDESKLQEVRHSVQQEIAGLMSKLWEQPGAEKLNPKSPAQVKNFLQGKGYTLPKKYDTKKKRYKESSDEKSLKKLRLKHPQEVSLELLLKLSKLNKAHSSYLSFGYDADKRMRYSLTAGGTETMRMAGHTDPWGRGVNPQTVPGGSKGLNIKQIFLAPEGFTFLQIDLAQAESRFVAYDSADLNLIRALEDPARDVHSETASEICRTLGKDPEAERQDTAHWKKRWRQLGKKSGHGANYSMKELTFIDSCIVEMDLVLTLKEANGILESYHKLFPGIRRWHESIRRELGQTRRLATPFGWERRFYGRLDDDMFRQAYAFRPQSTIPFITNTLMLYLLRLRDRGLLKFNLLLQCHDSLLLEVQLGCEAPLIEVASDTSLWHPHLELAGGILKIPTSIELGRCWGTMEEHS